MMRGFLSSPIFWMPFLLVNGSTVFLKEIIQGRCYDRPPTGDFRDCPSIVDSFMAVLESQLDSDFTDSSFDSHFESIEFSVPENEGVMFVPDHHFRFDDDLWKSKFMAPSDSSFWITPEYTPSGALLAGLVFCGVDRTEEDCSSGVSNAYGKYWEALYGRFAANARGPLQVIVSSRIDTEFLKRSIVDKIDPTLVSNVTIYGDDCSSTTTVCVMDSFQQAGVERVICSDDPIEFLLCMPNQNSKDCIRYMNSCIHQENMNETVVPSINTDAEQREQEQTFDKIKVPKTKENVSVFVVFIFGVVIMFGTCVIFKFRGGQALWDATMDKMSDVSSISSGSRRRRREEAVRESSALLDEVTRNLFMDPNNREDDGDLETVILQ